MTNERNHANGDTMRWLQDDAIYNYKSTLSSAVSCSVSTFILTRFNIPLSGAREKGGFGSDARFREWCISRSRIFNSVCLPSVTGQIERPTAWLILFDERYLNETAEAIKSIAQYEWIVPIIVNEREGVLPFRSLYTPEISKRLCADSEIVATCRLDNDDAIARSYIYCIVDYCNALIRKNYAVPTWLSFPIGAQWDGEEASLLVMNNNPFLTLVERASVFFSRKATTAMSVNHGRVYERGDVLTPLTRFPMWLQHTHSENVSNRKNLRLLKFRDVDTVLGHFCLPVR